MGKIDFFNFVIQQMETNFKLDDMARFTGKSYNSSQLTLNRLKHNGMVKVVSGGTGKGRGRGRTDKFFQVTAKGKKYIKFKTGQSV